MARRYPSGGMIARSGPGVAAFNLHNQGVTRARYHGARGSGFTVEFLSERARQQLDYATVQGTVIIRASSIAALAAETDETKQKMRLFLDAHFTGSEMHGNNHRRVSNAAVQSAYYDDLSNKGQIASLIYSKFGFRGPGGFVDFLLLHMRGGTVRPVTSQWLKIPNLAEPGSANGQVGYFAQSDSTIFFAKSKSDPDKLFLLRRYRGKGRTALLATLVKSLRIEPSLAGLDAILADRGAVFERHFNQVFSQRELAAGIS